MGITLIVAGFLAATIVSFLVVGILKDEIERLRRRLVLLDGEVAKLKQKIEAIERIPVITRRFRGQHTMESFNE